MPHPTAVSLVVPLSDPGSRLTPIVRWVDAQDLPYSRYQVIYLDQGSTDGTADRLADLARHRPNVTVVTAPATDPTSGIAEALGQAAGEYTLLLGRQDRLHPWALSTLLERAAAEDADVVLGRSAATGPVGFVPDTLTSSWEPRHPDAAITLIAPLALVRTSLLSEALTDPDAGWRTSRLRLLDRRVATVADPPVGVGPGSAALEDNDQIWADADSAASRINDPVQRARFIASHAHHGLRRAGDRLDPTTLERVRDVVRRHAKDVDPAELAPAHRELTAALLADTDQATVRTAVTRWDDVLVRLAAPDAQWQDGVLELAVTVTVTGGPAGLPDGAEELQPYLMLRDPASWAVHHPPVEVTALADNTSPGTRQFVLTATIDVTTAAAGRPLGRTPWQLQVRLRGSGSDAPATRTVPAARIGTAAVVDGEPVSLYSDEGQLRIDVGATKHSIFGSYRPAQTRITESAAGSLLTVQLPDIAVRGDSRRPGKLYLGGFGLPATLVADGDGARIECWVSGLAGVSPLSAHFPPARRQPLGLQLRIGAAGDLAVEPAPVATPASKPNPKPAPAKVTGPDAGTTKAARSDRAKAASGGKPTSAGSGVRAESYPGPSDLRHTVLPRLKPAGALLPRPLRRRARKLYRKLIK